jgi:hypothetical protein
MSELEKLRLQKIRDLAQPKKQPTSMIPASQPTQFLFDPANPMITMGAIVPAQMPAKDYFRQHPSTEYLQSLKYLLEQEIARRRNSSHRPMP